MLESSSYSSTLFPIAVTSTAMIQEMPWQNPKTAYPRNHHDLSLFVTPLFEDFPAGLETCLPIMRFILSLTLLIVSLVACTLALPTPSTVDTPPVTKRSLPGEDGSLNLKREIELLETRSSILEAQQLYERALDEPDFYVRSYTQEANKIAARNADSTVTTFAKAMLGLTKRDEELAVRNDDDNGVGLVARSFFSKLWKGIKKVGKKVVDGVKKVAGKVIQGVQTVASVVPLPLPIRRSVEESSDRLLQRS
ncbi:hypothetical protein H0H93_009473 [Arthromyces matolae]|nr:hypothetical protein H0H93_009473 [Arthromyces matolae]